MKQRFWVLVFFCLGVFFFFTFAAFATGPDDSPPMDREGEFRRKNGDMTIYWYGTYYGGTSGRLGSPGNRNYRGGGLHGGK